MRMPRDPKAIDRALEDVAVGPVDEDRAMLVADATFGFEDLATRTKHLADALDTGGRWYVRDVHAIDAATNGSVASALATYFSPELAAFVRIDPEHK